MPVSVEVDGVTVVAHIEERRIEGKDAAELRRRILEALPAEGARVAVDLSRVDFLDSSALGALVSVLREVRPTGDVALYGARPGVAGILRVTRLDAVFCCVQDRVEALEHLAQASTSA